MPKLKYPLFKIEMPRLTSPEMAVRLNEIWDRGWYTNNGPMVKELEQYVAALYGYLPSQVVTVANATLGLILSVRALQWSRLTRALLPSFTFPATMQALQWNDIPYRFGDVRPDSLAMDLDACWQDADCPREQVIYVMPLGVPDDRTFSLGKFGSVIVDAAGCLGLHMRNTMAQADATVFSLHATKPMGVGEGGVVICKSMAVAEKIRRLANFGLSDAGDVVERLGMNAKLNEVTAAMALVKLKKGRDTEGQVVETYVRELGSHGIETGPPRLLCADASMFPVLVNNPAAVEKKMLQGGVQTRRYYRPLHRMLGQGTFALGSLAVTNRVVERLLLLPLHADFKYQDVAYICEQLKGCIEEVRCAD
jgi:dTDP-4-amino-4,6-dideoxygalactose transaminase